MKTTGKVTKKTIQMTLSEHPFFKGFSSSHIEFIAGCASNVNFKAGDVIFREGQKADKFYIVRHGKIVIEIFTAPRGTIKIQTIENGEALGWSWLIPPHHWRFDARAIEATSVLSFDGKCLREKCEKDHHLGYEFLKKIA